MATQSRPPLVDLQRITSLILDDQLGIERVRVVMNRPEAPRPVVGGRRGVKTLWNTQAVVDYLAALETLPLAEREVGMSNPLIAGLAPQVCPLPADAMVSDHDLARACGLADARALHSAASEPGAPSLPFAHRIGGELRYGRVHAQAFIDRMRVFLADEAQRVAQRNEEAKRRHADAMAEAARRNSADLAAIRERQAMFRSGEAESQRLAADAEAKAGQRQVIVLDAYGRRVS